MTFHFRPGRVVYQLWHRPVAALRRCQAEGGPLEQWRNARGRSAMRAAARNLTPLNGSGPALELHLLTGTRFWDQTAFCLWSFARQSGRKLAPVIYDDGTLGREEGSLLRGLFPAARFITRPEAAANLERHLPAAAYPFLHDRWRHYPNIRKLIDPHIGSSGWKLVIDSDLLFFHPPAFLADWLDDPDRPLHAVDHETSYGYDRALMDRLAGARVADLVNVGLTGLRSDELDWDHVEYLCRGLITATGTHYFLEQALVAMLVAGRSCAVAPAPDYVTMPSPAEAVNCSSIMHHYVANSKRWYFRDNWRRVLA
jgi:hypothetical protein